MSPGFRSAGALSNIARELSWGPSMIRVFLAGVGVALAMSSSLSARAAPPPLSAYGALPAIEDVTISRDGSQLAYIAVSGER